MALNRKPQFLDWWNHLRQCETVDEIQATGVKGEQSMRIKNIYDQVKLYKRRLWTFKSCTHLEIEIGNWTTRLGIQPFSGSRFLVRLNYASNINGFVTSAEANKQANQHTHKHTQSKMIHHYHLVITYIWMQHNHGFLIVEPGVRITSVPTGNQSLFRTWTCVTYVHTL